MAAAFLPLIGIANVYLSNALMHPYYIHHHMQIDIYSEMHNDPLDELQSINLSIAVWILRFQDASANARTLL